MTIRSSSSHPRNKRTSRLEVSRGFWFSREQLMWVWTNSWPSSFGWRIVLKMAWRARRTLFPLRTGLEGKLLLLRCWWSLNTDWEAARFVLNRFSQAISFSWTCRKLWISIQKYKTVFSSLRRHRGSSQRLDQSWVRCHRKFPKDLLLMLGAPCIISQR